MPMTPTLHAGERIGFPVTVEVRGLAPAGTRLAQQLVDRHRA